MKDWIQENEKLSKVFTFGSFNDALEFVNQVGTLADECNHHPDICIRNYNEVHISTTTHEAGNSVTSKDMDIAKRIDALVLL